MTVNDTSTNQLIVVVNRRAVVLFMAHLQAKKNRARSNGEKPKAKSKIVALSMRYRRKITVLMSVIRLSATIGCDKAGRGMSAKMRTMARKRNVKVRSDDRMVYVGSQEVVENDGDGVCGRTKRGAGRRDWVRGVFWVRVNGRGQPDGGKGWLLLYGAGIRRR